AFYAISVAVKYLQTSFFTAFLKSLKLHQFYTPIGNILMSK
ncbi:unnamed protein product, partial [marine sediment metagenome]